MELPSKCTQLGDDKKTYSQVLGDGWIASPSTSRPDMMYYFNVTTGKSTWDFREVAAEIMKKSNNVEDFTGTSIARLQKNVENQPTTSFDSLPPAAHLNKQVLNNYFLLTNVAEKLSTHATSQPMQEKPPTTFAIMPSQSNFGIRNQCVKPILKPEDDLQMSESILEGRTAMSLSERFTKYENANQRKVKMQMCQSLPNNYSITAEHKDLRLKLAAKRSPAEIENSTNEILPSTSNAEHSNTIPSKGYADDEDRLYSDKLPKFNLSRLRALAKPTARQDFWYIVVDTNVLIGNIQYVNILIKSDTCCRMMVPYRVQLELDAKCRTGTIELRKKARRACRYLTRELQLRTAVIGQTAIEAENRNIECIVGDDDILNCCLQLSSDDYHVILLSNDKRFCTRSNVSHIPCFTVEEVKDYILGKETRPRKFVPTPLKMTFHNNICGTELDTDISENNETYLDNTKEKEKSFGLSTFSTYPNFTIQCKDIVSKKEVVNSNNGEINRTKLSIVSKKGVVNSNNEAKNRSKHSLAIKSSLECTNDKMKEKKKNLETVTESDLSAKANKRKPSPITFSQSTLERNSSLNSNKIETKIENVTIPKTTNKIANELQLEKTNSKVIKRKHSPITFPKSPTPEQEVKLKSLCEEKKIKVIDESEVLTRKKLLKSNCKPIKHNLKDIRARFRWRKKCINQTDEVCATINKNPSNNQIILQSQDSSKDSNLFHEDLRNDSESKCVPKNYLHCKGSQNVNLPKESLENSNLRNVGLRNSNLHCKDLQDNSLHKEVSPNSNLSHKDLRNDNNKDSRINNLQNLGSKDSNLRNESPRDSNLHREIFQNANLHTEDLQNEDSRKINFHVDVSQNGNLHTEEHSKNSNKQNEDIEHSNSFNTDSQIEDPFIFSSTDFYIKQNLIKRMSEWIFRYFQIMEKVLKKIYQIYPIQQDETKSISVLSIQKTVSYIKNRFQNYEDLLITADKLLQLLNSVHVNLIGINSTQFMSLLSCSYEFVLYLKNIIPHCKSIQMSEKMFFLLLCDIEEEPEKTIELDKYHCVDTKETDGKNNLIGNVLDLNYNMQSNNFKTSESNIGKNDTTTTFIRNILVWIPAYEKRMKKEKCSPSDDKNALLASINKEQTLNSFFKQIIDNFLGVKQYCASVLENCEVNFSRIEEVMLKTKLLQDRIKNIIQQLESIINRNETDLLVIWSGLGEKQVAKYRKITEKCLNEGIKLNNILESIIDQNNKYQIAHTRI